MLKYLEVASSNVNITILIVTLVRRSSFSIFIQVLYIMFNVMLSTFKMVSI